MFWVAVMAQIPPVYAAAHLMMVIVNRLVGGDLKGPDLPLESPDSEGGIIKRTDVIVHTFDLIANLDIKKYENFPLERRSPTASAQPRAIRLAVCPLPSSAPARSRR